MNKQSLSRRPERKSISHANRGKTFEKLIDITNTQYKNRSVASIHKLPTPVHINKTVRNKVWGTLTKGELVDYIGIFEGHAIAFDAKSTKVPRLPLANIQQHQYEFLKRWHRNDGVAFLLVEFAEGREVYYLPFVLLEEYYSDQSKRKSIPYKAFEEQGFLVESKNGYLLDYISTLEEAEGWN